MICENRMNLNVGRNRKPKIAIADPVVDPIDPEVERLRMDLGHSLADAAAGLVIIGEHVGRRFFPAMTNDCLGVREDEVVGAILIDLDALRQRIVATANHLLAEQTACPAADER